MPLAETSEVKLELRLARLAQAGSTGVLEVLHGKRRRRFFLHEGELVGSTSNLKKEQPEYITSNLAGAPPETIHEHVGAARLAGALAAPPSKVVWQQGRAPKRAISSRLRIVLWEAFELAFETDALIERIASEQEGNPKCKATTPEQLTSLGLPLDYRQWLAGLDGFRTVHEVIQFGPGEPCGCVAAIYLAWIQGAMTFRDEDLEHSVARATEEPSDEIIDDEADSEGGSASVFADLTSLIAASVTPHDGGDPEPSTEAAEPPQDVSEPSEDEPAPENDDAAEAGPQPTASSYEIELDDEDDSDDISLELDEPDVPFQPDGDMEIDFEDGSDDLELADDEDTNIQAQDWSIDAGEASLRAEIHRIQQAENVFEVLGVPHDSEVESFRSSYFHLARILHPDRVGDGDPELQAIAAQAFDRARAAWELVKDDELREETIQRVIHGKKSEEEEAMQAVEEMLAVEKLFDRGLAQFNSGRIVQAYEIFQQAAQKSAKHPDFELAELRIYQGYCRWRINHERDEDQAASGVEMLQKAMGKCQRHQPGWILLGRVVKERGHPEEARRFFIKALKLNPENKDALREMERLKREKEGTSGGKGKGKGLFGRLFSRGKKDKKKSGKKGD